MRRLRHSRPRRACGGVSMIEVLIAIVVSAVGLLGLAALQGSALQNNHLSAQYTQAAMLAQSLSESMRANRMAVLAGDYDRNPADDPPDAATDCSTKVCTSSQLAAWDLARLLAQLGPGEYSLSASVPLASGMLGVVCADAACSETSPRVITVYWDAARSGASLQDCDPASPESLQCFRLVHVP